MQTAVTKLLGIEHPIISAPMGPDMTGPDLVARGLQRLGTRFLASSESSAHPAYKQKLVAAVGEDTVHTILFGHGWPYAPVRTLRTPFVEEWLGNEKRGQESRPDEPVVGHTTIAGQHMPLLRFMGMPPNADSSGDIELRSLLAGQAVGLIHDIKPAQEIVRELVEGVRKIFVRSAEESS